MYPKADGWVSKRDTALVAACKLRAGKRRRLVALFCGISRWVRIRHRHIPCRAPFEVFAFLADVSFPTTTGMSCIRASLHFRNLGGTFPARLSGVSRASHPLLGIVLRSLSRACAAPLRAASPWAGGWNFERLGTEICQQWRPTGMHLSYTCCSTTCSMRPLPHSSQSLHAG